MLRRYRWVLIGLAVLVAAPIVGTFLYFNVFRDDPPERLSLDDVTTTTGDTGTTAAGAARTGSRAHGPWATGASWATASSEELFGQSAEAVGRSEGVTGSLTIDGTTVTEATFEVDMTTFESDESRRDGQFEGRIMEVDRVPHRDLRADRADRAGRGAGRRGTRSRSRPPAISPSTASPAPSPSRSSHGWTDPPSPSTGA